MVSPPYTIVNLPEPAPESEPGFGHYWKILKRRWLPTMVIFTSVVALVTYHGFRQTPIYQAEGKLRYKSRNTTAALTGLGGDLNTLESSGFLDDPISTEMGILRSVPVIRETIQELDLTTTDGSPLNPRVFLSNLALNNERGTDILTVTYQSADPDQAADIVNALMAVYADKQLEANRAEAAAAREFIEAELPTAESRAQQTEAALREFKERNQIIALEEESLSTVASLAEVEQQMTGVASQLADVREQFNTLEEQLARSPRVALAATKLSQSPGIRQVLEDYQQAEVELATERTRYQDQHPAIGRLTAHRDALAQVLQERIIDIVGTAGPSSPANLQLGDVEMAMIQNYIQLEATQRGMAQQALVLQRAQDVYEQRVQVLPRLEQEYRELVRRLEAAQSTYTLLLQRLQEVRVAENQNVGNVRIIQPAEVLGGPLAPNKKRYIVLGIVLGAALAAGLAFVLEKQDQSIRTVEEAQAKFKLPVLGVIPSLKQLQTPQRPHDPGDQQVPVLLLEDKSTSLGMEAYHMLRSNLKFLNSDQPPKVIAITSSLPKEGKSTVSSNLAVAMAQAGQRVLLIDANLHHPIQHWTWNKMGVRGLSNVLVGDAVLSESIVSVMPHLHILFAGSLPPNPAALLDSHRMVMLLRKLKAHYDFVVLDAPPLSGGASASILGKIVDGLLLVVRPGVANVQSANYAKALLDQTQPTVLGLILNGVIPDDEPYGRYFSDEFFDETSAETNSLEKTTRRLVGIALHQKPQN